MARVDLATRIIRKARQDVHVVAAALQLPGEAEALQVIRLGLEEVVDEEDSHPYVLLHTTRFTYPV